MIVSENETSHSPRRWVINVGELGEFGLIDRVVARFTAGAAGRATLLGPGDDAAVVAAPDRRVVATTDLLVEGRHFRRDWSSAVDVGHRAAAANLADVAAMGAVPTALLLGLACPADLPVEWAEGLAEGLAAECAVVGAAVVGGDVVRSDVLTIAVTALGDLQGRTPVTRSGAAAGDIVAVAGRLGWAAAGLAVLSKGFRSPAALVDALRRPQPPYAEGPRAAELAATAMCDVSDGLVQDLGHIARESGVGIDLDPAALPVSDKLRDVGAALGVEPIDFVLGGGDDHALVATFPSGTTLPEGWLVIGRVVAGNAGTAVTVAGEPVDDAGYTHF